MGWQSYAATSNVWCRSKMLADQERLVTAGTLQFQLDQTYSLTNPVIFQSTRTRPWAQSLCCRQSSHGDITVSVSLNEETCFSITCPAPSEARSNATLVTFSWNRSHSFAALTVEDAFSQKGNTATAANLMPPLLQGLMADVTAAPTMKPLDFVAYSDRVEPVGPMPGIHPLTQIDTLKGSKPACDLNRGDTILTTEGPQTILARLEKEMLPVGVFAPVRLLTPHLGLRKDILLARHQPVYFSGSTVEYELGLDSITIPAAYLEMLKESQDTVEPQRYYQFLLAKPAGIQAHGALVQSLNIGRMRRDHDALSRSLLASLDPAYLPDHGDATPKPASDYAAHLLLSDRLA